MEPFVLLSLAQGGPAHGYELAQSMAALGFRRAADDASVVYKLLRGLEDRGFLTSEWGAAAGGPPPRIYRLTATGRAYLDERAVDLERQAKRIKVFLERYRRHGRRLRSSRAPGKDTA
ncbi:MAG: helix-turn-helix transcriptional regulator [Actinomycetota bacterium]|jgi:DNA-binding PadR family transcriptional regulator|nr:helix-turn-helix transcriptional regulator [Actinomycetota bacterium]